MIKTDSLLSGKRGFSLIELCLVLIIGGLIISGFVSGLSLYMKQKTLDTNKERVREIHRAMAQYIMNNGHYPLPARIDLAADDADSGISVTSATDAIVVAGPAGDVVIGGVPVSELNLPLSFQLDAYNYKFTYAVSEALTHAGVNIFDHALYAVIPTSDGVAPLPNHAPFVIVSHGREGTGAFTPSGDQIPCPANTLDRFNCDYNNAGATPDERVSFLATETSTNPGNTFFDDTVTYALMSYEDDELWQQSVTDPNDIHTRNTTANVGIGTTDPEASLHTTRGILTSGRITASSTLSALVLPTQGGYLSWNEENGTGMTNFSNHPGTGTGGFSFNLHDSSGHYQTSPLVIEGNGDLQVNGNTYIGSDTLFAKLFFGSANQNSDPIYFQRRDDGANLSSLILAIGDDPNNAYVDHFEIGALSGGIWTTNFKFSSLGDLDVRRHLSVGGDSSLHNTLIYPSHPGTSEGGQISLMDAQGSGAWEIDNYGADGSEVIRFFRDKAGEATTSGSVLTVYNNGGISVGGTTSSRTFEPRDIVTTGTACSPDGIIARDTIGRVLSCQSGVWKPQFFVKEETGAVVGCNSGNDFCGNTTGAPPNTTSYDAGHGGKSWKTVIGPRSFCALGFVAFGTNDPAIQSLGDFCRVLPNGQIDATTGKPIWEVRVGSTKNMNVACHAVCME